MKIYAISTPATNRKSFTGIEKAAQETVYGAAKAAGKTNTGKTGVKFLHAALGTVKYIGTKVLKGISTIMSKVFSEISNFVKSSKSNDQKTEAVFADKSAAAKGTEAEAFSAESVGAKIIPFKQKPEETIEVLVAGKKFVFRPEKDKLPEGATIQNGTLVLASSSKYGKPKDAVAQMREAIQIVQQWGKDPQI